MRQKVFLTFCLLSLLCSSLTLKTEKRKKSLYASTASQSINYQQLAYDIFYAANRLRANPQSFIPKLQDRLQYFSGNTLWLPGKTGLTTWEGPAGVNAAIQALQNTRPLAQYYWSPEGEKAAQAHADDLGSHNTQGAYGTDGSTDRDRMTKQGCWLWQGDQVLIYRAKDADDVIADMWISDGSTERTDRTRLLNNEYTYLGTACAAHPYYESVCVLMLHAGCKTTRDDEALAWDMHLVENQWRSNPQLMIPMLEERQKHWNGLVLSMPGKQSYVYTEGPPAINEAIQVLRGMSPLPQMGWDANAAKGALDHAKDIGSKNMRGHNGSDGSDPTARVSRYCNPNGVGENIDYGQYTGWDVLIDFFVDDGVANRGHRTNLMTAGWIKQGISCAPHVYYRIGCVVNYLAEECTPKSFLELASSNE